MINNDFNVIGWFYLEYLFNIKVMVSIIRVDKGMEIGIMVIMYVYFC